MPDPNDLVQRIEALEAENMRLRQLHGLKDPNAKKPTTSHITMYKGHPVIQFEGAFRPFALGLKKASIVLEKIDDVRFFVENNKARLSTAPDDDA